MLKYEMDKSYTLSAHEFYKKHYVEEKCLDIFEEVDDGQDDNSGLQKKSVIPTIPLDLAIKEPPSSHEELTKFLQEHLRITNLKFTSVDDQKQLADILTMAITSIWPEHRRQGPDPFLSEIGNKELQRRIAVYVVQTAEELFYEYISKAEEINGKAVFSAEANLSRLKTQILHEANTCLNVLKVRRKLAAHMRHVPDDKWFQRDKNENGILYPDFGPLDTKTKSLLEKCHHQFAKRQLAEIDQHMKKIEPSLDTAYIDMINEREIEISTGHNEIVIDDGQKSVISVGSNANSQSFPEVREEILDDSFRGNAFIQRSSSMPNLQADAESREEFGEMNVLRSERRHSVDQLLDDLLQGKRNLKENFMFSEDVSSKMEQDLHVEQVEDDDFSPLLQVQETQPKKKKKVVQSVVLNEDTEDDLFSDINVTDELEDGESIASYRHLAQPSYVNVKVPGKGIVRISDVSISTRINESVLILHKYPTMYNEFLGEIDDATVKSLDEHLFAGKQAQEVYDEITKTMNKDFLCFDKDDFVEKCAPPTLDTSSLFMSEKLQERQKSHLISEKLRSETQPPWSKFHSNDDWRNQPRFGGLGREEILQMQAKSKVTNDTYNVTKSLSFPNKHIAPSMASMTHLQKSCSAWLSWYKTHLDTDDYKKFLCKKENDYLCQIFHLYDSEDSEDEEEEDIHNRAMEIKLLEEQQRRKEEIRMEKKWYEKGYWNTQCVVLGGLGKDPDLNDAEVIENSDDIEKEKVVDNEKVSTYICLQERLERIWKLLKAPEQRRVDMAMKYSDIGGTERLTEAIEYWESVTDLIIERENLMGKLEGFERSASDPNRFFQKGPSGSSVARINEANTREKIMKAIKKLEGEIKPMLAFIQKTFGDVVTYQGRIYSQKLQTDRVEMLYWLQQERRQQALSCLNTSEIPGVTPVKCKDMTPIIA